jgi:hypothetical protein
LPARPSLIGGDAIGEALRNNQKPEIAIATIVLNEIHQISLHVPSTLSGGIVRDYTIAFR